MDEKEQKIPSAPETPETPQTPEAPKKPARSKSALTRYLTVLFAVAFLLVLLSYFIEMRNMNTNMSELKRTSSNWQSNVALLQTTNQALSEEKSALEDQIDALEEQVDALETELSSTQDAADTAEKTYTERVDALEAELTAQEKTLADTTAAYEALSAASAARERGDLEALRAALAEISDDSLFSDAGAALYASLTAAAEASTAENGAE